jgi:hypothetical protein
MCLSPRKACLGAAAVLFTTIFTACSNPADDGTKDVAQSGIGWSAYEVGGAEGTKDSESIQFTFKDDPGNLTADDITLNPANAAIKGELSAVEGNVKMRSLKLEMVNAQGNVAVSITKEGIAAGPKNVMLYRQTRADGSITWLVEASGHDSAGAADNSEVSTGGKSTSRFVFTFSQPVDNLQASEIHLGINGWRNLELTSNTDKTIWTLDGEIVRDIHTNLWQNLNAGINHTGVRSVTNTQSPKYYEAVCTYWSAAEQGGISGSQPSQSIDITFGFSLSKPLYKEDVTITNGTGMAAKGTVTRIDNDDKKWRIALAGVEASGTVTVTILKAGVMQKGYYGGSEIPHNTVSVISTMAANDFAVEQVGGTSGTVSTTEIKLTFTRAVASLAASDITITASSGNAALRSGTAFTSSADKKIWTVPLTVAAEGQIKVKVTKPGVDPAERTVTVYKKPGVMTNESGNPDLEDYLAELAPNTASSPATVRLHDSVSIAGDWGTVNQKVTANQRYVILDLSACPDTSISGRDAQGSPAPSGNDFNIIRNNQYIKGIILPASLTEIGDYAFQSCNNITQVGSTANILRIPAGVTRIGTKAFYSVNTIGGLVFETRSGSSTLFIGDYAFATTSGISTGFSGALNLPENITFGKNGSGQASYTFQYRSLFTSLVIGSGCSEIPEQAFSYCSGLQEVTLPASISSILAYAFRYDYAVTRFTCGRGYDSTALKAQGGSSESTLNMYKLRPGTGNAGLAAAGTYLWNSSASTWDLQ